MKIRSGFAYDLTKKNVYFLVMRKVYVTVNSLANCFMYVSCRKRCERRMPAPVTLSLWYQIDFIINLTALL